MPKVNWNWKPLVRSQSVVHSYEWRHGEPAPDENWYRSKAPTSPATARQLMIGFNLHEELLFYLEVYIRRAIIQDEELLKLDSSSWESWVRSTVLMEKISKKLLPLDTPYESCGARLAPPTYWSIKMEKAWIVKEVNWLQADENLEDMLDPNYIREKGTKLWPNLRAPQSQNSNRRGKDRTFRFLKDSFFKISFDSDFPFPTSKPIAIPAKDVTLLGDKNHLGKGEDYSPADFGIHPLLNAIKIKDGFARGFRKTG